jgi:hypothetical protein
MRLAVCFLTPAGAGVWFYSRVCCACGGAGTPPAGPQIKKVSLCPLASCTRGLLHCPHTHALILTLPRTASPHTHCFSQLSIMERDYPAAATLSSTRPLPLTLRHLIAHSLPTLRRFVASSLPPTLRHLIASSPHRSFAATNTSSPHHCRQRFVTSSLIRCRFVTSSLPLHHRCCHQHFVTKVHNDTHTPTHTPTHMCFYLSCIFPTLPLLSFSPLFLPSLLSPACHRD